MIDYSFDKRKPTLWILEGLLFYLSSQEVDLLVNHIHKLSALKSKLICDIFGTGLLSQNSMQEYIKKRNKDKLPMPYCNDYPEQLFGNYKSWKAVITYCGSRTANYGKVKEYEIDLDRLEHRKNNSFFMKYEKLT